MKGKNSSAYSQLTARHQRKPQQRPLEGQCSLDSWPAFLQDHLLKVAPPAAGGASHISHQSRKCPYRQTWPQGNLLGAVTQLRFPLPGELVRIKLTQISHYSHLLTTWPLVRVFLLCLFLPSLLPPGLHFELRYHKTT